uniref:Copper-transporting ATPase n=1 Tax=Lygus hesperus TaxID=30085 RepID=A0A0A9XNC6_LYGHE
MSHNKTIDRFNSYLSKVSDRDRVMSIVQYTTMALYGPAAKAGCSKLSENLLSIMELASQYRAITRFSQWLVIGPQLTPEGIRATYKSSPTPFIAFLKTLSTALFSVFLLGEEIKLFSKLNIVSAKLGQQFNRVRFVFLFWSNVLRLIINYLQYKRSSFDKVNDKNDAHKVN